MNPVFADTPKTLFCFFFLLKHFTNLYMKIHCKRK